MFLLRLGEGRSRSTLPLTAHRIANGDVDADGVAPGQKMGQRDKRQGSEEARVRVGEDGCWTEGSYTKVLEVRRSI